MSEKKISKYKDRVNYSEQTIQRVLYEHFKKMYYRMSNIYMFGGKSARWECDFFFVTKSKRMWEVEIKVDRQDFDRDFELKPAKHKLLKQAYESNNERGIFLPHRFYFCAPEGVIPHDRIPPYAGLIEIHGENKDKVRYVGECNDIHDVALDIEGQINKKLYNKCLSMEKMLADFRIKLFEDPDQESEIVRKFLKRIRM